MRRLTAMIVLLMAFGSAKLEAQLRGMAAPRAGAGAPPAFRSGMGPIHPGMAMQVGRPGFPSARMGSSSVFIHGGIATGRAGVNVFFGNACARDPFCRNRFFVHRRFFPSPVVAVPVYYGYPTYPLVYPDYSEPAISYAQASSPTYQQVAVEQQLAELNREIQLLRDEEALRRQREEQASAKTQAAPAPSEPQTPTVLILKSGKRQEAQNYAIVGETLWIFDAHRAQKLSIKDLDVAATIKANADNGVDFRLPSVR